MLQFQIKCLQAPAETPDSEIVAPLEKALLAMKIIRKSVVLVIKAKIEIQSLNKLK